VHLLVASKFREGLKKALKNFFIRKQFSIEYKKQSFMLVSKPFRQFQKVDQLNFRKIFRIFSRFSSLHKSFVPYLSWVNFLKLFFNGLKSHTIPVVIYMHFYVVAVQTKYKMLGKKGFVNMHHKELKLS
jgi:hypothetical protein